MPATSLADWLRGESDDALAELLRSRRDLSTPPPSDSTVLASRAGTPGSVARACEDLDTVTLAVLEACLLAGADRDPVPVEDVAKLVGADIAEQLARLRARALAWGADDALRVPPAVREGLGAVYAGLGSVARACEALDTVTLAVLEACLLAGADRDPVPVEDVAKLVGADIAEQLARLRARALAWGADDALRVPPAAREALGPFPAGLG